MFQGISLISFYFVIFVLPAIGLGLGILGIKRKSRRHCIYGLLSVFFILFIAFFPIHTVATLRYSKEDSLLKFFEENFSSFEDYSFGKDFPQKDFSFCRLGAERVPNEKYDGVMTIELEYRTGTLFSGISPDTKFKNIIVYSEKDIAKNNPRPELFKKITPTSHENWYFVHVTDGYEYF